MARKTLEKSEENWKMNLEEAIKNDKYKAGIAEWLGVRESEISDVPAIEHWKTHSEEAIKENKYAKGVKAYWLKK